MARFTNCTAMFLENSVESRSDAAPSPRPRNPNRGSVNWIEDGLNTSEDIETEIWRHALDLAEPGGLGRLVEADAVVQALILTAGRLAEHTDMPPALFYSHVVEATRRLIAKRDEDAPRT